MCPCHSPSLLPRHSLPGDRIAILSQGSLICCGSFEYLRHHYGRGHQLSLVTHSLSSHPPPPTVTAGREEPDGPVQASGCPDSTTMISQLIQVRQPSAPPLVGVARVLPLPPEPDPQRLPGGAPWPRAALPPPPAPGPPGRADPPLPAAGGRL